MRGLVSYNNNNCAGVLSYIYRTPHTAVTTVRMLPYADGGGTPRCYADCCCLCDWRCLLLLPCYLRSGCCGGGGVRLCRCTVVVEYAQCPKRAAQPTQRGAQKLEPNASSPPLVSLGPSLDPPACLSACLPAYQYCCLQSCLSAAASRRTRTAYLPMSMLLLHQDQI